MSSNISSGADFVILGVLVLKRLKFRIITSLEFRG